MRALVVTEPSVDGARTAVRSIAAPRPAANEVSIDVVWAGLNFVDVMARRGDPGYAPGWPFVPGREVVGTIREIGTGVTALRRGQLVLALTPHGGLAEVGVADAALVARLPRGVPLPRAAAIPMTVSTAVLLLDQVARIRPGETLLMHSAAGGVGSAVAQVAAELGAGTSIGTVGDASKVGTAFAAGWSHVYVREDKLPDAIRTVAEGGVDVILDPSGTALLDLDLTVAAPGARIVLFGNPAGEPLGPLPPLGTLIAGNLTVAGFSVSRLMRERPSQVAAALRRAVDLVADKRIHLPAVELPSLDDVPSAYQAMTDGSGAGKYLVRIR